MRIWLGVLSLLLCIDLVFMATRVEAQPPISAQSAVLMEKDTGRVLYEKNMKEELKIASITKIMTAILAIESGKLDDYTTVSSKAANTEGSSIYLRVGEKIKVRDLVYGLMLRSGNNAAVAIAEAVGGSVDGFVYLMNEKAQQLGMKNTYFSNPSGLDEKGKKHYSSAYDMALLTRYAISNPTYKKIAGTKFYNLPDPKDKWNRVGKNKHKLVTGGYKYATTGKTGYTKQAGRTLVTTAEKDGVELIVVTIRDGNDWKDHVALFDWGFSTFKKTRVASKGVLEDVKPFSKGKYYALPKDVVVPLTKKEADDVKVEIVTFKNPVRSAFTNHAGWYKVVYKGKTIYKLPLVLTNKKGEPLTTSTGISQYDFWKFVIGAGICG